ncbi:MAG: branched-chain amino acid transport system substrate-binding protein [Betaproteobacteria bacterium]|jgi:ABC-type branched-subunit amino acid transport system substrate-binding protein|nr:branched-chain amino acid transport system substrate-binding protein [Betaproteobacteria bacterium]
MLRFVLLALAVFAGTVQAQVPGVTARSIVIGQSAPLTGANAELGNDIRNGALAYLQKINDAGGVHGRRIELVTLDDGNAVPRAEANTKKLVEEQAVFALYGYASATLSRPALPFVEKSHVPFVGPFTGADPMRVFNKYVYNIRGSYAEELEKIVDHFVPLGVKRFSIVYYDDVVGRENLTAVDRALKARGLQAVSTTAFKDRAKPDIAAGVQEIAKGQPDVVILTTLYKATSDFIKLARSSGMGAQWASNSFPGASPLAKELGGKDGAGVIVATVVPPPTKRSLPIVQEYQAAIEKQLGKKDLSFTSLESFIGAKVMVEALRRAGPKLTREGFMRELDNMKGYDTGGYIVGFSPANHNGSSFVELTVIGRDLKFSY